MRSQAATGPGSPRDPPRRRRRFGRQGSLALAPVDRACRPGALDNPLRRWFAPPSRELDLLGIPPGGVVADLGAGVGYFAPETLRRLGPTGRLYLIDPDEENLEIARHRVGADSRVHLVVGSAASIPTVPSASVDRALLSLVLCCLVDKEGALDEAFRILRPGGRALVTWPRTPRLLRRRSTLRMTHERWSSLVARHPWETLPVARGRVVERRLLRRP